MNIVTEIASMRGVLEDLQKRIGTRQAEGITDMDPLMARLIGRKIELERALEVVERLSNREAAMCDLHYAEGAKRGFEWGQHDDNDALSSCVEGRVPEAVRELKELRHEVEMRKLQVTGAAKVIQEEKNDNSKLREERDQLKAAVSLAIQAFYDYGMDVDTYPTTEHIRMMDQLHGALAQHDAEVIERAAGELFPGTHQLQKTAHKSLCDYANKLRQPVKPCPEDSFKCEECRGVPEFCKQAKEVQS